MGKAENRFWKFIIKHRLKILVLVSTLIAAYSRFVWRGFITGDMEWFLLPWYHAITSFDGLRGLSAQVGNYQISYQTLIALMKYLPVHPVYAYKGLSILFDFLLGAAAAACVYELSHSTFKASLTYMIIINLPTVVLNSSAWGQCDSIFTFFLVMTFLFLLKQKYIPAFVFYGLAFSFKLQAVFLLPFLLFYYVWSRHISIFHFLLIPGTMIVASLGGIIQGRGILDPFSIYLKQADYYKRISLNYPSFWNLMVLNDAEDELDHYAEMSPLCMGITVILLTVLMIWLIRKKKLNFPQLLLTAALMMYTCLLFLPAMHERYGYPLLIFSVMICMLFPRAIPVAMGLIIIDMQTYGMYLFQKETLPWEALTLINIACYAFLGYITVKAVNRTELDWPESPENRKEGDACGRAQPEGA